MAIDQERTAVAPDLSQAAAIENELPAYRAISGLAVASLVLGVLSVLCFADPMFLLSASAAVILGVLADQKIQRMSDVLTGRGFAQAGVALGLIFGLSTTTVGLVQDQLRKQNATKFAKSFVAVLKSGTKEDAFWYTQHPEARKDKTPLELWSQFQKGMPRPEAALMETQQLDQIREILGKPGGDVHFETIEKQGAFELDSFATALLEVHEPGAKDAASSQKFALLRMKGAVKEGKTGWYVEKIDFPYKPDSYTGPVKPVDDGHGHGH